MQMLKRGQHKFIVQTRVGLQYPLGRLSQLIPVIEPKKVYLQDNMLYNTVYHSYIRIFAGLIIL
jgi:hypothetical protein